jgi:hypothetical protein
MYVEMERQAGEARHALSKWTDRGEPSFDGAYLTTWHKNIGFLKDPRFLESYTAGMASGFVSPETHPINLQLQWRTAVACWAAAHAKHLAGDFVECGVNTGSLSLAICRYIDFNASGKQFFLFDTYKGIPLEQMSARDQRKNLQDYNQWYPDCWDRAAQNFRPYAVSQRVRKRIEEAFGWIKTVARQEKTKFRGRGRVGWAFTFAAAAYNLVRLPKLIAEKG